MKYCVTTVCLPEMDMVEQARFLQRLGYDGMELRVRRVSEETRKKSPSFWGYHRNDITPEIFAQKAPEIRHVLNDHGLALAGIASSVPCTDIEQTQRLLEGAAAVSAPFIRVGASGPWDGRKTWHQLYGETVAGYARVVELARGTGVKIVLEIHNGTIHPSASLALRIVEHFDPRFVGVIYDVNNLIRDGLETPAIAFELLGPYLAHVHAGAHRPVPNPPDEHGTVRWEWQGCRLGEGLLHFPTLLALLHQHGYQGFISVEDFRNLPSEEKFSDAIRYLRSIEPRGHAPNVKP